MSFYKSQANQSDIPLTSPNYKIPDMAKDTPRNKNNRNCCYRYKWWWVALVVLILALGITACVLLLAVKPPALMHALGLDYLLPAGKSNGDVLDDSIPFKDSTKTLPPNPSVAPNLKLIPKDLGSFDDNNSPNDMVPSLDQGFPYGSMPIRGVNLGGWLVLEPFLSHSLFSKYPSSDNVIDEWTLLKKLGKKDGFDVMKDHYDTFLTEDHIKKLKEVGINHVRIPVGYWMIDINNDEPFVYGSWEYLLRGIQWCRKYGIRVLIDFHAAPGSQNGWNHSGRSGDKNFLNSKNNNNDELVTRFVGVVRKTQKYFSTPQWKNVVTMIGVLNEPFPDPKIVKEFDMLADFYKKVQTELRNDVPLDDGPWLTYSDGFQEIDRWGLTLNKTSFPKSALDIHDYVAFSSDVYKLDQSKIANIPCEGWKTKYQRSKDHFAMTVTGEFSAAVNDCGVYLNGMKLGSRLNGDFDHPSLNGDNNAKPCTNCACYKYTNYGNYTTEFKGFLKKFVERQMETFEAGGGGWFFWNFRTQDHLSPAWDFLLGVEQGWIPNNVNKRENSC
jgi:aryl-phospho-beta-D-glucosidase BglC (GH1 family)